MVASCGFVKFGLSRKAARILTCVSVRDEDSLFPTTVRSDIRSYAGTYGQVIWKKEKAVAAVNNVHINTVLVGEHSGIELSQLSSQLFPFK